jgi:molecular chaperone GrpE (heat shock protein)
MRKPSEYPEFQIVEEPRPVDGIPERGTAHPMTYLRQRVAEEAEDAIHRLERAEQGFRGDKRKFFLELIENVLDNLDRSLADPAANDDSPATVQWVNRLKRTRRRLLEVLATQQVVPFDLSSATPGMATVRDVEDRDDVPEGTILEQYWRAYLCEGQILRTASVKVAKNTRPKQAPPGSKRTEEGGDA